MSSSLESSRHDENANTKVNGKQSEESLRSLSPLEMWNLIFSLLAWACTVSNVTLGKSLFCHKFMVDTRPHHLFLFVDSRRIEWSRCIIHRR
jgi:hypothetical protein